MLSGDRQQWKNEKFQRTKNASTRCREACRVKLIKLDRHSCVKYSHLNHTFGCQFTKVWNLGLTTDHMFKPLSPEICRKKSCQFLFNDAKGNFCIYILRIIASDRSLKTAKEHVFFSQIKCSFFLTKEWSIGVFY